jgi:PPOX class probable F420-dependent enzyme
VVEEDEGSRESRSSADRGAPLPSGAGSSSTPPSGFLSSFDPRKTFLTGEHWRYLEAHRVGHLTTVDVGGGPSVVPFCYATDGAFVYSALDEKPKRVRPEALARVRNLLANPQVAFVVDDYDEDWTRLQYLLVHGEADLLEPGREDHARAVELLREKYLQYREMAIDERPVVRIEPLRVRFWKAAPGVRETQ